MLRFVVVEFEDIGVMFSWMSMDELSFVLNTGFSGMEVMSFPEFSFFPRLTLVSIEQIAVLVVFGEKKM